jgi:hypothetical protein
VIRPVDTKVVTPPGTAVSSAAAVRPVSPMSGTATARWCCWTASGRSSPASAFG